MQTINQSRLAHHILPNASTMLGVCLTGIGLVKVAEAHIGPSRVDEFLSLDGLCFLVSCLLSYASIRGGNPGASTRNKLEQSADFFFMLGLIGMALISVLFAYELVQ
ncbi:MAG: hypothetical protein M3178_18015 [Pseudomonadota bacterium]|nr:hypothetical protein [Pseudomonadota bacterium]